MPFCYRSRLLLLLCLLTFSARDFLGAFPHTRSKCRKYQNLSEGEREIPRLRFHYLHFGKEIGKKNFCILLHFVSCPSSTKKYWGRNREKDATTFAYSIPKKQIYFQDLESRRGDVHKKKTTKYKLSPCPFSQFGAETQATATGNSLSAPEIITSAATSWQISPCAGLKTGAHHPS